MCVCFLFFKGPILYVDEQVFGWQHAAWEASSLLAEEFASFPGAQYASICEPQVPGLQHSAFPGPSGTLAPIRIGKRRNNEMRK